MSIKLLRIKSLYPLHYVPSSPQSIMNLAVTSLQGAGKKLKLRREPQEITRAFRSYFNLQPMNTVIYSGWLCCRYNGAGGWLGAGYRSFGEQDQRGRVGHCLKKSSSVLCFAVAQAHLRVTNISIPGPVEAPSSMVAASDQMNTIPRHQEHTLKRKLQVFISSTFTDLIHERQAAVGAVLKAGHIPAGMELFTAGDRSQMATIKEWIDESDVYMLILGGRYGSIEVTTGISYTELEYDYAVQQGKPVFAVVITEEALEAKVKAYGTSFFVKENTKELGLFREKVLRNVSSFFEDYKDIKLCVHESMADFSANRDLKGWVSGDEVADTKPLFDEIRKLSEENRSLKEALSVMEKRMVALPASATDMKMKNFEELREILSAIEIKIPASISNQEEGTLSLLDTFTLSKDVLITGVTNSVGTNPTASFLYHNICPKLQVHGLIVNESVANVRYRRSSVSKLGTEFLADLEKTELLKGSISH